MLIRLTLAENRDTFYMRAKDVRTIQKDTKDRLTTIVTTDVFTQTGPIAYRVMEKGDDIAEAVNRALRDEIVAEKKSNLMIS